MDKLLLKLLQQLEKVAETNEEIFDTEVRERMGVACMDGFVRHESEFMLPSEFGLTTNDANAIVRAALDDYINAANEKASSLGIVQFHDRLTAFQNSNVVTEEGNDYEEFFGHTPGEFYDKKGNVIRTH